jgi:glycosyltransferase involved in cell wall biosynthesis
MTESKNSFRFHVLSLPHTVTTPEYNACAYTMKVLKFCKMMRARGHYIIHYGHKDSVVDADEHVTLLDNDDLLKAYGSYNWRKEFFKHNINDYANTKFQTVGTTEVLKRLSGAELRNPDDKRKDFVLAFWGIGHGKICDAVKATGKAFICEPGIGYSGSFMDFRVFESYAWMHTTYGEQRISRPSWYHCVIPNYFDPEEFHYSPIKSDYYLCLGRINTCKGVHIAIQAAKKLGITLVLAGQGDIRKDLGITDIPENVIYYGYADVEARKRLMAYAKGFILLSAYIEPFGGAAVEALMSGTPVICPDWGVFSETVPHGLVGYRVRTFDQITWAIQNIDKINPANCRSWAMNNYSLEKVGKMYETYFIQLADVWEKGWYQEHPERTELDWLEKTTPDEPPYLGKDDDSSCENSEMENFNLSEISKLKIILEEKKELMKTEEKIQQNIENLKHLFLKYNTDKFNDKPHCHTYHNRYGKLFYELKDKPLKVFEMGIGTVNPRIPSSMEGYQRLFNYKPGASHRAWNEYFSHIDTRICGGDIDEEICKDEMYIEFAKIKCKAVDQTDVKSVKECFTYFTTSKDENKFFNNDLFDIIIDDGLHTEEGALGMLRGAWDYLKVGGIYAIEDLNFDYKKYIAPEFHQYCEIWCEPKNTGNVEDNYIFSIVKISNKHILNENFNIQNSETENLNISEVLNEKFNVAEISENIVLPEIPNSKISKKIAIWCENKWAMGRIHNDLIKYMKKNSDNYDYHFDYLDWNNLEATIHLIKKWEEYDIIISNTSIYNSRYNFFKHLYENPKFLSKILCVSHCPLIEHEFYGEKIDSLTPEQRQGINLGHISKQGVENLKNYYNLAINPYWLPCGVDLENFKIKERINFPLKNIGFIGTRKNKDIKRSEMFDDIISKTDLTPVYIHSKPFTQYDKLYEDIDLLICTSEAEAGPLGIFEAAACGIPVLSTKVGNVSELQSLMTFETVEQAVEIIEYLNKNPAVLQEYLVKVTDEVRNNWSAELLISKYWKPVIDSIIDK